MARRIAMLVVAALLGSLMTGCVVTTSARSGILEVRWNTSDCATLDLASVRVTVIRDGVIEDSSSALLCTRGSVPFSVPPGLYTVEVEGFDSNAVLVTSTELSNVSVFDDDTTTTRKIPLMEVQTRSGAGAVSVNWTIFGKDPANGCKAHDIKTVTISLLNKSLTQVTAHATVPCNVAKATILNVPLGEAWVQLDATTNQGLTFFGNKNLYGPVLIQNSLEVIVPAPLDIVDLRSSVAVQWQFKNAGTCLGNNVGDVLIEVRDGNDKVVVPVTATDARKPCEITDSTPLKARAIDLLYSEPTCTIPPGAKGLIICGITTGKIGVRMSTIDKSTGQILFGGSMEVLDIPAGTHTDLQTKVILSGCTAINKCVAP